MKSWRNIARGDWNPFLLPTSTLLGVLITWEVLVKVTEIEKWLLPAPSVIIKALWSVKELIWQHSLQTMQETFLGLALAVVVGVIIATAIDWSEGLKKAVYPLIIASQTIPIIAVAPLLIIWFGYGLLPKVLVVALVCFFPITVNLTDGYRLVEPDMLRLMSAMGADRGQIFRMV